MSGMRAVFLTARRELRERGRSRAFLVSTVVQVAIVLVIVLVSSQIETDTESFEIGTLGHQAERVADAASAQQEAFAIELEVTRFENEETARAAVEGGESDAVIAEQSLITKAQPPETLVALIQQASRTVAGTEALRAEGLSAGEITAALQPDPLEMDEVGEESGSGLAFLASLLLYVAILASGYAVATGVVEEKSSRVVEVILSAIKPVHLLAGKVAGIGLLSLGQLLIIVLTGVAAAIPAGAINLPDSTGATVALVAVYFVLGYLLYACAFAVTGAIVSRQEDVQNSSAPLMLVLIVAYLAAISVADSPESSFAVIATFIPPLAPMVVPARAAQDALPVAELVASLALMVIAVALLLWLAARVYDRTVLRMGAPVKLGEVFRIARSR